MTARNQSLHGSRIVSALPFLRTRYGRALFYIISSVGLMFFNDPPLIQHICLIITSFCGLMLGAIAMQPGNPLDYRGF